MKKILAAMFLTTLFLVAGKFDADVFTPDETTKSTTETQFTTETQQTTAPATVYTVVVTKGNVYITDVYEEEVVEENGELFMYTRETSPEPTNTNIKYNPDEMFEAIREMQRGGM